MGVVFMHDPDGQKLQVMLMAGGMIIVIFGTISFIFRRVYTEKLRNISDLMQDYPPRQALMSLTGVSDLNGLLVALFDPDSDPQQRPDAAPWGVASVMTNRKRLPFSAKVLPVDCYVRPHSTPPFIALDTGKMLLWGKLTNRESREKNWRNMRLMISGMCMLFLAILSVFIYLQTQLLQELDQKIMLAHESEQWPGVKGVVTESFIKNVRISKGKSSVPGFRAVVAYTYAVNGRNFEGDNVFFCYEPHRKRKYAEEIVTYFKKGSTITVYHAPDDASLSVLQPGIDTYCENERQQQYRTLIIVSIMCSVGFLFSCGFFLYLTKRRNQLMTQIERWGVV